MTRSRYGLIQIVLFGANRSVINNRQKQHNHAERFAHFKNMPISSCWGRCRCKHRRIRRWRWCWQCRGRVQGARECGPLATSPRPSRGLQPRWRHGTRTSAEWRGCQSANNSTASRRSSSTCSLQVDPAVDPSAARQPTSERHYRPSSSATSTLNCVTAPRRQPTRFCHAQQCYSAIQRSAACLFVCPSHAGDTSKLMTVRSRSLHHR